MERPCGAAGVWYNAYVCLCAHAEVVMDTDEEQVSSGAKGLK